MFLKLSPNIAIYRLVGTELKAHIFLQISSIVTYLKEKQSEEFLASLILRTLA